MLRSGRPSWPGHVDELLRQLRCCWALGSARLPAVAAAFMAAWLTLPLLAKQQPSPTLLALQSWRGSASFSAALQLPAPLRLLHGRWRRRQLQPPSLLKARTGAGSICRTVCCSASLMPSAALFPAPAI